MATFAQVSDPHMELDRAPHRGPRTLVGSRMDAGNRVGLRVPFRVALAGKSLREA